MRTHRSTKSKIVAKLKDANGLGIWDVERFFNHSVVKDIYGITHITVIDNDEAIFHIIDEKKFLLKVLKYGF